MITNQEIIDIVERNLERAEEALRMLDEMNNKAFIPNSQLNYVTNR